MSVNAELRAAFSTFFGNPHVEVDQEGFLRFVGELGGSLVQNNIFNMLWRECDVAGTGKLSFKECLSLMDALLNLNEVASAALPSIHVCFVDGVLCCQCLPGCSPW